MVGRWAAGGLSRLAVLLLLVVLAMKFLLLWSALGGRLRLPLTREGVPLLQQAAILGSSFCEYFLHNLLRE